MPYLSYDKIAEHPDFTAIRYALIPAHGLFCISVYHIDMIGKMLHIDAYDSMDEHSFKRDCCSNASNMQRMHPTDLNDHTQVNVNMRLIFALLLMGLNLTPSAVRMVPVNSRFH